MIDDKIHSEHVVRLLARLRSGDRSALAELTPLVYRELHALATTYMRRERRDHTLQATALVNEAFARLVHGPVEFADERHFVAVSARLMRHILVDYAKARVRVKRGGVDAVRVPLENLEPLTRGGIDVIEIDDALSKLEEHHPTAAKAMELHYFGGLTLEQTAQQLDVSQSTLGREIRFARAWLISRLKLSASSRPPSH
jgi:RNA polymerase sigma factor (TIGR02999 family)